MSRGAVRVGISVVPATADLDRVGELVRTADDLASTSSGSRITRTS